MADMVFKSLSGDTTTNVEIYKEAKMVLIRQIIDDEEKSDNTVVLQFDEIKKIYDKIF